MKRIYKGAAVGIGAVLLLWIITKGGQEEEIQQKLVLKSDIPTNKADSVRLKETAIPDPYYTTYVVHPSFALEASVLYWQATQTGLVYATDLSLQNQTSLKGHNHEVGGLWDWGFQVGLTYQLPTDGWDLYTDWIHFRGDDHNSISGKDNIRAVLPAQDTLLDELTRAFVVGSTSTTARAKWEVKLDLIDLEVGRQSYLGKRLLFRLHAGLRNAWLNQYVKTTYHDLNVTRQTSSGNRTFVFDADKKQTNNFWGIGPRVGFDTQWNAGAGVSFFGDAALSGLIGRFHLKAVELVSATSPNGTGTFIIRDRPDEGCVIVDVDLGIRWETKSKGGKYSFMVDAGWDYHLITNQNQFLYMFNNNGNFVVQGASLKFKVGF